VGFGYQLTPNTVIRGGYGIFWLPSLSANADNPWADPLNFNYTPMINTVDGGITPHNKLANPFPSGVLAAPGRSPAFESFLLGAGDATYQPDNPFPGYVQQWNFNVQQQLRSVFIDLAYSGSRGIHIPFQGQLDQLNPQYMSMGPALFNSVPNPFAGLMSPTSALDAPTVTAEQLLLPYPQFTSVGTTQDAFDSRYDALQLKVQKHLSNGQQVLVAYTVSKLITNTDTLTPWLEPSGATEWALQNFYNLKGEESLASFDVSQRMVANYVLELPVGHGKKFLSGVQGPAGKAVSGWGAEGVTTLQKGFPLFLSTSENLTGVLNGGSRPDFDPSACSGGAALHSSAESRLNMWFNTSCYVQPPAFTYGNVSRTLPNVRTDGISNFDFALFKNTTFGPDERLAVQFRAEFFNLFNTPQFGNPGMTVGTSEFGVISSQLNNPRLVQFGLKFLF
jgi:hypothetical protein